MRDLIFEQEGKKKRIERRMAMHCHICGASLTCPDEADFWAWLKCGDVLDFERDHRAHGFARAVGAEIKMTETVVD